MLSHSANATAACLVTLYGRGSDLCQEAGCGRGRAEVPIAALQPAREQAARRPPVGVDVDVERPRPEVLVVHRVGPERHAGVGEVQIDRAVGPLGGLDHRDDARLVGHVGRDRERTVEGRCDGVGAVQIGERHPGPGGMESGGQGGSDSSGGSGHHDVSTTEIHGRPS